MLVYVWAVDRMVQSKVPASVLSMLILFFALLLISRLPHGAAAIDRVLKWSDGGVEWLLKWMTLMFAPAVVIIPAQDLLSGREIGRVIGGFVIGLCVFFPLSLWSARGLQYVFQVKGHESPTLHESLPAQSELGADDVSMRSDPSSIKSSEKAHTSPPTKPVPGVSGLFRIPIHPFTLIIFSALFGPSLVIAFTSDILQPVHLCITILAYYIGLAMPRQAKILLHPLLTCGFLTIMGLWAIAGLQGHSLKSAKSTKILTAMAAQRPVPEPGAGDVLYSLLDAAVAALAVRMYKQRQLLREYAATILTAVASLSIVSLFFHVGISKAFGMDASNSLAMGPRFVTTPLALQIFDSVLTEANTSLGVVMILVSGVIGDVVGLKLAKVVGFAKDDNISLGVTIGITSHAVGTAGLLQRNPAAAAVSSLTFVLFATASVIWTSIPPIADALRTIAR
ncbi:LrgB-like family-domain-containing protein [Powellomyces hirtus]|nr:LrgB-like family-domain-containing protein [Powellomyces hirtus]